MNLNPQAIIDNLTTNSAVDNDSAIASNFVPAGLIETFKFYVLVAFGITVLAMVVNLIAKAMTHQAIMSLKKDVREINHKLDKLI